ncbi:hypothetical protein PHYC_02719 [Phycisphaerales bacterium]|nr:hypothetical protein PHYC_02719 [Phycisphaerales bacterium]
MKRAVHMLGGLLAAMAAAVAGPRAPAQGNYYEKPVQVLGLDVEEHIGDSLPMELTFTNEEGRAVRLGDYFKGTKKPAVVTLVYYSCPVVCDVVLTKQAEVFGKLDYTPGVDFTALVFSFDHNETFERAAQAKEFRFSAYDRRATPGVSEGWRYHVGEDSSNRALADALGFRYRRLGDGNYSHPICQFVITPDGRISRYLYGYPDDARDLKLALMEASEGKLVRTVGERFLSFCYVFDESSGKYTLRVFRIMQIGGAITLLIVGSAIGVMLGTERLRRRKKKGSRGDLPGAGHGAVTTG